MTQRKTQTPIYWQEQFTVSSQDIEFLYNRILEEARMLDLNEIAITIVSRHCREEEVKARSELQQGKLYQPKDTYEVGEKLIFPVFDFAAGTVEYSRSGKHPNYGTFAVIGVDFGDGDTTREFVAKFDHPHALNIEEGQSLANVQGMLSPEELYETYKDPIQNRIKAALEANEEFVAFHDLYFLRDLLSDFHEGLFNIADAAIDINNGPLAADSLIEQMGIDEGSITDVLRLSVNYRLDNDERFDDVGPAGQVLWYLERLEPPEAHHPPRRLQTGSDQSYDSSLFDEDLKALLAEIDDELTDPKDVPAVGEKAKKVTIVLNYPHRRVGTLPITPKTQSFFPISYYNPVLFNLVDGYSGETFPGWVSLKHKYVFGLEEWYSKNKLPVGAYITLKRTDDPMRLIVEYDRIRMQRDWVRQAAVVNHKLAFQMNTEAIGCKYDELMIIGEANPTDIDGLWISTQSHGISLYTLLRHIFPELSKLNPQSTVHSKTLYSAVNVIYRAAPGVVFQEMVTHGCFIPMRHGYWLYDATIKE